MTPLARQVLAIALLLLLTAGCTGKPHPAAGPRGAGAAAAASLAKAVQLAQVDGKLEDDDGFGDLFPGEDPLAIEEDFDPFETVNRFIFALNEALDFFILRPAAALYGFLLPDVVRDAIRGVVRNLLEPVNFVNHLWQGKTDDAADIVSRFFINTTIGLGGLIDVADYWGMPYRTEDFGQTLGFYGADAGPYLVLPLLGPSSLRDAIGRGVDSVIDPWGYVIPPLTPVGRFDLAAGRLGAYGIDLRQRNIDTLDDLKRDSVDFYARVRSLYLQSRRAEIGEGSGASGAELSSMDARLQRRVDGRDESGLNAR